MKADHHKSIHFMQRFVLDRAETWSEISDLPALAANSAIMTTLTIDCGWGSSQATETGQLLL